LLSIGALNQCSPDSSEKMIYIIPISLLYLYLALDSPKFKLSKIFYFILFILGFISIFRGMVGVDTPNYEYIVSTIRNGGSLLITEPGFSVIIWLFNNLFDSDSTVVRVIALIYLLLTTTYYMRADNNEKYLLISYIIPAFYFNLSMNAIRIGLASMIFMLCVQHANKFKREFKIYIPFFSFFFHYSMLFSNAYRWATMVRWRLKSIFILVLILLFFAYIVILNADYFLLKWMQTMDIQSPNTYSGISKVLIISILLAGLALSKMPKQKKIQLIIISSTLTILFYFFARYTYGGLRALELIAFVLPVVIMNIYKSYDLRFCLALRICFFIAGIISFAAFYRNIYFDSGVGEAPFLPYKFIFF
jgi:hypothetical protein